MTTFEPRAHVGAANSDTPAEVRIDVERPGDARAIDTLLERVFAGADHRRTSARLRKGRVPAEGLSLVARGGNGQVIGTVRMWHVAAGSAGPALLLGPMAVHPWWRDRGVGAALLRAAIARAASRDHRAILLVGDAPYYSRFGFTPTLTVGLDLPGPVERPRFLALELVPGALADAEGLVVATGALVRSGRRLPTLTAPARRAS